MELGTKPFTLLRIRQGPTSVILPIIYLSESFDDASSCYGVSQVQYGIFPDDFTFNLLIDAFLKNEDYQGQFCYMPKITLN